MPTKPGTLKLTPDELLMTTRAVRRRLDLTRPVEREVLEDCLRIAQQAPTGSNLQNWHFVVVTDAARRAALAALYRQAWELYRGPLYFRGPASAVGALGRHREQARIVASAEYLAEHLHEVPVHVIPCITGRTDGWPAALQAGQWAGIIPAAWSFMLAARARSLGTCWTTLHLLFEPASAMVLGIPYPAVMQAALIPVAYTRGTTFKLARRAPLDTMVHWDQW
jgi:nitroreductase